MPRDVTKGLRESQQDGKAFVGGYCTVQQKRRITGAAMIAGTSVSGMLAKLIDGLSVDVPEYDTQREEGLSCQVD